VPRDAKPRRWLNAVIVAGVAAVAVAAIVNFVGSDEQPAATSPPAENAATETQPPDTGGTLPGFLPEIVALPAELREEGGLLWWAGGECEADVLDVSSGLLTGVPGRRCQIWPAPQGARAAALTAEGEVEADPSRGGLVIFGYPAPEGEQVLGEGSVLRHSPGFVTSEVVWHPKGHRVAVCVASNEGTVVDVLTLGEDGSASIEDACFPAFLADGRLSVVHGAVSIELDGSSIAGEAEAAVLLPSLPGESQRFVTALGAGGDRLVVGLAALSPSRELPFSASIAVLTPRGRVEFSAHLRPDALPAVAGLAPDGKALWYYDASSGTAVILEIPGGRRSRPYRARWLAWSPSGDYLATVTDGGVEILSWPDAERVATLDVPADVVAWTRRPDAPS
jgi:hypothetical protein